jgi:hypothetical protein
MVIWSNSVQDVPESDDKKMFTRQAEDVAEHCASISRTRVPDAAPVNNETIVPDPSRAVFAADRAAVPITGVPINEGDVAIICSP